MKSTEFKDHFSGHASSYAEHRPKSPRGLFDFLASVVKHPKAVWDVGTGNGQAAIELTSYFDSVIATDASREQIRQATSHPKVTYRVAPAEDSGVSDGSIDLITAAQAVHWFDFERFYSEVRRVAKPNAVIAVWTYELASITPEIDELVRHYYDGEIGKYWPPERKWVDEHYQTIPFPFREIEASTFRMKEERTLSSWVGYLFTWSATQRAIKEQSRTFFGDFVTRLQKAWGDPASPRTVVWPLYLRAGYTSYARFIEFAISEQSHTKSHPLSA